MYLLLIDLKIYLMKGDNSIIMRNKIIQFSLFEIIKLNKIVLEK